MIKRLTLFLYRDTLSPVGADLCVCPEHNLTEKATLTLSNLLSCFANRTGDYYQLAISLLKQLNRSRKCSCQGVCAAGGICDAFTTLTCRS